MPKQSRWQIKRKFDQAAAKVKKAAEEVAELGAIYQETHPQIGEALGGMYASLVSEADLISSLGGSV